MRTRWIIGAVLVCLIAGAGVPVGASALDPPIIPHVETGLNGARLSVYFDTSYTPGITISCGTNQPNQCQLWVTRNGNPIGTEVLVANVNGTFGAGPGENPLIFDGARVPFPDGCLNLRLYIVNNHTLSGFLVGATAGIACNSGDPQGYGTGKAVLNSTPLTVAGGTPSVQFDSGYLVNVDVAEIWIQEASGGTQSCAGATFGPEVLLTQNTGGITGIGNIGGGPYRFHLYFGTEHKVETAPVVCSTTPSYFVSFVPNTSTPASIAFNTGFSFVNGLICVYGPSIPGSSAANQSAFTFNSRGWNPGNTAVPFQTFGAGTNTYTLRGGVATDAGGAAAANACTTGTVLQAITITT